MRNQTPKKRILLRGAAAALAVLACGAEMINEAVVTGAIALGTTLFGLL